MNHQPARFRSVDAEARPLSRRAVAKQETRDKVLQAAKRLFIARGYEAATIRDISAEAGMSTGAVFANFQDKADLFDHVLKADLENQMVVIDAIAIEGAPVETTLRSMFSRGYQMQLDQLPLLQAAASLSWTEGLNGLFGDRPAAELVINLVNQVLIRAREAGEVAEGPDLRLISEMLWDAYVANYRRALFDGWGLERLNGRLADQISVILAGARA